MKISFRPYDLKVIHKGEKYKDINFPDYYTISASGIVHVFNEKYKGIKQNVDYSTEVTTLSDWMHESTMFNIIS